MATTVKNEEHIIAPAKIATFEDPRTGVRTVAFPVKGPDSTNYVVSVTRLKKGDWEVSSTIEEINIIWNKQYAKN